MIRKPMERMKVKRPNGIAKQKFLVLPVKHPRHAINIPMTPITMMPIAPLLALSIPLN